MASANDNRSRIIVDTDIVKIMTMTVYDKIDIILSDPFIFSGTCNIPLAAAGLLGFSDASINFICLVW